MEKAKELWKDIRALDGDCENACNALVVELRNAANALEARIDADATDYGWAIHGVHINGTLVDYLEAMSNAINAKLAKARELANESTSKFEILSDIMDENEFDYSNL